MKQKTHSGHVTRKILVGKHSEKERTVRLSNARKLTCYTVSDSRNTTKFGGDEMGSNTIKM